MVSFDRVNHDKPMAKLAERVGDKRLMKLIRAMLTAGVLENGLVGPADAVAESWQRKFPGFSFTKAAIPKRRIAPKVREVRNALGVETS